jgi:hypothetical protein
LHPAGLDGKHQDAEQARALQAVGLPAENTLKDQVLNLLDDCFGKFGVFDLLKNHPERGDSID